MQGDSDVGIRIAASLDDFLAVSRLGGECLGSSYIPPPGWVRAMSDSGAIVLLAYLRSAPRDAIGFSIAMVALGENGVFLRSYGLGVAEPYRRLGVATTLKRYQFAAAVARGFHRIVWSFDEHKDYLWHFYLDKLGASYLHSIKDYAATGDDRAFVELDL